MNQRLSTYLLFGALLSLPITARGQETHSTIARSIDFNRPSFQTEGPTETSRAIGPSVSARVLSIPERAVKAYTKGMDRLSKNDPAGSLDHFLRAACKFPNFYEAPATRQAQRRHNQLARTPADTFSDCALFCAPSASETDSQSKSTASR